MLQRDASTANASYSWWCVRHIRTKQSKWLDQSLEDMEEKVHYVLKLIEEDGDSFARRAEMYYKKRPELISFVEESYRAFRALAERYDHLSKEMQIANNTLATVCPEQFQLPMDDEDDDDLTTTSPKLPRKFPQLHAAAAANALNLPKPLLSAAKQLEAKKPGNAQGDDESAPKSGLSKDDALEEIGKLQKEILPLQTVEEFVRSSYQSSLSRYWGLDSQIIEKQQYLCRLQDEFSLNNVIEDDEEACTLMAEAALKSCQETLSQLQEKHENQESRGEYKKIEEARLKLESIRREFLKEDNVDAAKIEESAMTGTGEPTHNSNEVYSDVAKDIQEEDSENKEEIIDDEEDSSAAESFAVTQKLAEKIDELVNKVINLETAVSSQTVLIDRLRTKAGDLHSQTHVLEEDKANLIDDSQNLRIKVQKLEENLYYGIHDLNQDIESLNSNLQTDFAEARSSLDHLSEKLLSNVKADEDIPPPPHVVEEKVVQLENHMQPNTMDNDQTDTKRNVAVEEIKEEDPGTPAKSGKESKRTVIFRDPISKEIHDVDDRKTTDSRPVSEIEMQGDFDWQNMLLRNYKEVKNKLVDKEKKERDQITLQLRQLKNAVHKKKDEGIQLLRQRLNGPSDISDVKTDDFHVPSIDSEDEDIKMVFVDQHKAVSPNEEKLRRDIDALLAENIDFWLRFSTSYHQIGKFRSSVQDLQDEIAKMMLNTKKKQEEGSVTGTTWDLKCDARPIYKHLKEIQAELTVWIKQSAMLRKEVDKRFSSLCSIQEKISNALKEEGIKEEEIRFSSLHAARLQGEILNMKQENNKVREELQTGVDHVTTLQFEIDMTLSKLNRDLELAGDTQKLSHPGSRPHIPLSAFIFGTKQKKHRHSIFSYMHHSRKFQSLRSGMQ